MRSWTDFFTFVKTQGFNPETVVDVGVATDTEELYRHFPQARYLFVEPLAEFEPNLQALCKKYNGNYMLAAAGAEDGELVINVTNDLGGTSKFKTLEAEAGDYVMTPRTVPQFTLDSMWEGFELAGPALLKVDVQGAELEVLKGASACLNNFEFIVLEIGLIEQYVGQPIFHDYLNFMAERGFVTYDIIHTGFAETGLLAQIDMVFTKKDGKYRSNQRWFVDSASAKRNASFDYKGVRRNENL
jgi:FkbM family methyltransferase